MLTRVLIIGGYGNFGSFISRMLARENNIQIIIAGRNGSKAEIFAKSIQSINTPETVLVDIDHDFLSALERIKPQIVIHTSGPYQSQGYQVAQACIEYGCHYIDLADARHFVANISELDSKAKQKGVLICSGASSVPCLTSAVIDKYIGDFKSLESVDYGIATAQLTNRGLATTSAVLSYAGKPFKTMVNGEQKNIYGWLGLRLRKCWGLGYRFLGNCDIPDLEIFPQRYPSLKSIQFKAGLELKVLHLLLWLFSWLVRSHLLPSLLYFAKILLKVSRVFDFLGNDDSGFYMTLKGLGCDGAAKEVNFELLAHNGDGLYIPSMPAILMAKKLARGEVIEKGAMPCVGFIKLDEYLEALSEFKIQWKVKA